MALLGTRLQGALDTDILAQLEAEFPVSGSLTSGEQALLTSDLQKLATALSTAIGPDVVTEVLNATVFVVDVQPGSGGAPGTLS